MNNIIAKAINLISKTGKTINFKVYWFCRDLHYGLLSRGKEDLLNRMLVAGHIIEKGITMPNRHYGFGYSTIRLVIGFCNRCIKQYGNNYDQLQYAIDDLREYKKIHDEIGFKLPDDITENINSLLQFKICPNVDCFEISRDELFKSTTNFEEFAHTRHTSRYYSEEPVPKDLLIKAVDLAKTAPSACNRQSIKCIIATGETKDKVLSLQNGHRGFGKTIDKMIVVIAEQTAWEENFRTSAYLDGGLFTMNLLYALHHYKICACTLNAHLSVSNYQKARKILGMKNSEIVICFIGVGMPQSKMMIAKSTRLQTKNLVRFV